MQLGIHFARVDTWPHRGASESSVPSFLDGLGLAEMGAPQNAFHKSSMKPANDHFLDQSRSAGKYPSEDECYVRRFGSALLLHWDELSEELRSKILADAASAWDREFDIPHVARKLDAFIKRHLACISKKLPD